MSANPLSSVEQRADDLPGSKAQRDDVGATSAEHEKRQDYLQGARLRLITAAYVVLSIPQFRGA